MLSKQRTPWRRKPTHYSAIDKHQICHDYSCPWLDPTLLMPLSSEAGCTFMGKWSSHPFCEKDPKPKQLPDTQVPPDFEEAHFPRLANVIATNFQLGIWHMQPLLESNLAHVLAVTATLFRDCFTQIRWELLFVKECLSLTITLMPSRCPPWEYRMSTCISQVLWFKEEATGLNEKAPVYSSNSHSLLTPPTPSKIGASGLN